MGKSCIERREIQVERGSGRKSWQLGIELRFTACCPGYSPLSNHQ
jgi:hypothetical protein